MAEALEPLGLTHVQFVLQAGTRWLCEQEGPPRRRELAAHAGTDPMMTSRVVRALAAEQLLRRTRDPTDARALLLGPRPSGRVLALRVVAVAEAADEAPVTDVAVRARPAMRRR